MVKRLRLEDMTEEQRRIALEKTGVIERQIPWILQQCEGKRFPIESPISFDNIGSWFVLTEGEMIRLQVICTIGKGLMMTYVTGEGPTYYDCRRLWEGNKVI